MLEEVPLNPAPVEQLQEVPLDSINAEIPLEEVPLEQPMEEVPLDPQPSATFEPPRAQEDQPSNFEEAKTT